MAGGAAMSARAWWADVWPEWLTAGFALGVCAVALAVTVCALVWALFFDGPDEKL